MARTVRLGVLVAVAVSSVSCTPAKSPWTEFIRPTATLDADGLHVVANRNQISNLPAQGAGEGGTIEHLRADTWLLDGSKATLTRGAEQPHLTTEGTEWYGTWRAGALWSARSTGVFKGETLASSLNVGDVLAGDFGSGPDGGVAYATLRRDGTVRVWFEGDATGAQQRVVPGLATPYQSGTLSQAVRLSSGPRFGVVVSQGNRDGIGSPAMAWVEGGAVTTLEEGTPLAFAADGQRTQTVLRRATSPGNPYAFADSLYTDDAGVRLVLQGGDPIAYTSLDSRSIFACQATGFDPAGNLLRLEGHIAGFTLRIGAQSFNVPAEGDVDVSWCSVLADGAAVHLTWLERGSPDLGAPSPRLLHHQVWVNGAMVSTQQVDVATDLIP